ncbi:MAG: hypothetical protein JO030_06705 [Candidatus Eremiobacteraeota bacterium]|nr:hypothetical protein [Candidatus Eremiobacteraeota bacterium]
MTEQLQVSILAAPLAALDRRALSQAWYSALRLGQDSVRRAGPRHAAQRADNNVARLPRAVTALRSREPSQTPTRAIARVREHDPFDTGEPPRRRAARRSLAVAIEEAFAHQRTRVRRATFSMGPRGARVHVLLQTRGGVPTLIALCSPEQSRRVSAALAQARQTLAARGFVTEFRLGEEPPCS